jgi:RimJ/RimL family protein N-acetyltransferase
MNTDDCKLKLRRWKDSDREPFARMNADPRVMRFFPRCLTAAESNQMVDNIERRIDERGYGLLAAEFEGQFIGFIGLSVPSFEAAFTPCVEIGWRIAAEFWNRGLATEGASMVAGDAFERVGLTEIVSFTTEQNAASRRVMEKIGMTRNPADDFDHPMLEVGNPLRRHVLYRLNAVNFRR